MSKERGPLSSSERERMEKLYSKLDSIHLNDPRYEEYQNLRGRDEYWKKYGRVSPRACFVATACYGVDDTITESLRVWRDKQKNIFSLVFIHIYYAGVGKAGAKILNLVPFLKPVARKIIKIFIRITS